MPVRRSFFDSQVLVSVSRIGSLLVFAALIATSVAGCRSSGNTVKVRGHASYKGEALANGTVTFFPEKGRPTVAPVSAEGEYTAELAPAEYVVVVMAGNSLPEGYKEGDPVPPPKFVLPAQYTTRVNSTLKASVTRGQTEPINFDLK